MKNRSQALISIWGNWAEDFHRAYFATHIIKSIYFKLFLIMTRL